MAVITKRSLSSLINKLLTDSDKRPYKWQWTTGSQLLLKPLQNLIFEMTWTLLLQSNLCLWTPPISTHQTVVPVISPLKLYIINNGNRTEWSPIWSVIIRVINEIGRPHSGSPICLITSMITDRIGRHEVLLPINHIYNKISKRKGRKRTGEGIDNSFTIRKKNLFKCN